MATKKITDLTELLTTEVAAADLVFLYDATAGVLKAAQLSVIDEGFTTAFARTLLDDADAAAALTTLGITAAAQTILDDATVEAIKTTLGVMSKNHLSGLTLSNDTDTDHDIAIAVGECRDAADSVDMALTSILTKQIDATWASGDDAGGMNDGETVGNTTWYHVHLLSSADGATVDAGFDTSVTAANLLTDAAVVAAGLTKYRRLGSVLTDGSANIVQFFQHGDRFWRDVPVEDYDQATPGTSRVTVTLSVPPDVQVLAHISYYFVHSATWQALLTSPGQTDTAPGQNAWTLRGDSNAQTQIVVLDVLTNTSKQICFRNSADNVTKITTLGWVDRRGKDG